MCEEKESKAARKENDLTGLMNKWEVMHSGYFVL